ncbi:NmrA family NAD(P)-binding protein [Chroococcidiopsis sp. CCALA 051]|nr:NmrA family NAD(P)-binding protein [Chroococcidiopsis sp. CCALA 051]
MSNKILVTGATGNVGFEVLRELRERGYPVKAAVRSHSTSRSNLPS